MPSFQVSLQDTLNGLTAMSGPRPASLPAANNAVKAPTPPGPVTAMAQAPVTPFQPGGPPAMPSTNGTPVALPADTLEIGGQYFGKAANFGEIRQLADGIKPEDAAALTQNDGLDKIYFTNESGQSFVMVAQKSHFQDMKAGYLGRFNGQRVKVVAVDDEANTFNEGFKSVWNWLNETLHQSFGSEASKSISGLVATSIGTFIAAAAIKTTAPAAPLALPAASGFLKGMGNAAVGAVSGFLNTMASVAMFACGAVGLVSLAQGVRAYYAKGNYRTVDMVTGKY